MNIGIISTWFERGAAYVSRAYLDTLINNGHRVFIYARGGEKYARNDPRWDKEYVTWGKRVRIGVAGFVYWPEFLSWIKKNHLDLLIFNEQQSWDVILRCLPLGIPLGAYVDYYTSRTVRYFRLYDFLLCNTLRHYSVFDYHPQAWYIPWGTDLEIFRGYHKPVSDSEIVFFHSSGINPSRKGTDLVVKAFHNIHGNARMVIHAQRFPEPNLRTAITQDPRIALIEKTVSLPGMYHLGDVYVYPTRLEGIGLTIAEALASGLPVITTDNGPMNEFIKNEVNGRLVPVEKYRWRGDNYFWEESICNVEELTNAMQWYIDQHSRLPEFKLMARQYAEENLDWSVNSKELSNLLINVSTIQKSSDLIWDARYYEYSRYPSLFLKAVRSKVQSMRKQSFL